MMRAALVFVVMLVGCAAGAGAQQVKSVEITEFGIYTRDVVRKEAEPGTVVGVHNVVTNLRLAVATQTIPAQKGVSFGFRFVVVGSPLDAVVRLHVVTIFPSPMTNPANGLTSTRSEYDTSVALGRSSYKGYALEQDWELLPGKWRFQLWQQDRMLGEQIFTLQNR